MRGDSVRDFYAKALALLGLAVLAGTGALVDYWPTGFALPDTSSALRLPALAQALPVPADEDFVVSAPVATATVARASVTRRPLPTLAVSNTMEFPVADVVLLSAPVPEELVPMPALTTSGT